MFPATKKIPRGLDPPPSPLRPNEIIQSSNRSEACLCEVCWTTEGACLQQVWLHQVYQEGRGVELKTHPDKMGESSCLFRLEPKKIGGWDRWYVVITQFGSMYHLYTIHIYIYILPIGLLYATYHLLREPGNSIDHGFPMTDPWDWYIFIYSSLEPYSKSTW